MHHDLKTTKISKMGLRKGQCNNRKGRPVGCKNKTTAEIRELIVNFVSMNIDNLQNDYNSLDVKDKLIFFEKLLKMIMPKPEGDVQVYPIDWSELIVLPEVPKNGPEN